MEINIDRIKSRFGNKVLVEDIMRLYHPYKQINNVLKLRLGVEESIVKSLKCRLNIDLCLKEIEERKMEIKGYENDIILIKREEFDELRSKGKLMDFLWNLDNEILDRLNNMGCVRSEEVSEIKLDRFRKDRDNYSRNYNELNTDNDVSRVVM